MPKNMKKGPVALLIAQRRTERFQVKKYRKSNDCKLIFFWQLHHINLR